MALRSRGLTLPSYPAGDGFRKLSAAWLVEHAGFAKGYTRGAAAISRRHALAIVNRGGATAAEIVALKDEIQSRVLAEFGDPTAARAGVPGILGRHRRHAFVPLGRPLVGVGQTRRATSVGSGSRRDLQSHRQAFTGKSARHETRWATPIAEREQHSSIGICNSYCAQRSQRRAPPVLRAGARDRYCRSQHDVEIIEDPTLWLNSRARAAHAGNPLAGLLRGAQLARVYAGRTAPAFRQHFLVVTVRFVIANRRRSLAICKSNSVTWLTNLRNHGHSRLEALRDFRVDTLGQISRDTDPDLVNRLMSCSSWIASAPDAATHSRMAIASRTVA